MLDIQQWLDRGYLGVDRRLRGWPTLFIRTVLAFDQDDGAIVSRSIAYYALFSLFPMLLVLLAVASSLLVDDEAKQVIIEFVESYLPVATTMIQDNFEQVLKAQSTVSILAIIGLVWSASGVFTALYRAVNRAWGNPKSQLFWTEKLFGLAVVLLVGLILVATTFYNSIVSILRSWQVSYFDWVPLSDAQSNQLWGWLSTLVLPLVTVVMFIILYRTVPRNRVGWRDVWLGGLVAGLIWEGARRLYVWYLSNFANYSLIYGSVGAIIGFLLWAYLSGMIILLGAEFTAQQTVWRQAGRPIESEPLSQWIDGWSKDSSLEG
jgi:membrane protein